MTPAARATDRRTAYRVTPRREDVVRLSVLGEQGPRPADDVTDISAHGAAARFEAPAPPLDLGARVELTLSSAQVAAPLHLPASVRSQHGTAERVHYGFRFESEPPAPGSHEDHFWRLFNRRAAMRGVEPDPAARPLTRLRPVSGAEDAPWHAVTLANLSTTGACVLLDRRLDTAFASTRLLEVSIGLPGTDGPMRLRAERRHRAGAGHRVRYGLRFDPKATPEYLDKAEEIFEYMAERLARAGNP